MNKKEFLSQILPEQGHCAIVTIDQGVTKHYWFQSGDLDGAVDAAATQCDRGRNVYFACAKFKDSTSRTQINALAFKSFWVDLDCGPTKPYLTQADGLTALDEFLALSGLPRPTLVNSGNGYHCYWVLDADIDYNEWKPTANALKAACVRYGLRGDMGITSDAARVLRVPETKNFKDPDNIKDVYVQEWNSPISAWVMKDLLGVPEADDEFPDMAETGVDDLTKSLMGGFPSSFKQILKRSIAGTGCAQILWAYRNQNEVKEPLWRAVLSIAQFCDDRREAIHRMSNQCEAYNPSDTEIKANGCKGPFLCTTIEAERPEGCAGCTHKDKIQSPITLGKYIAQAKPEDNIVTRHHEGLDKAVTIVVPDYPYPYFRIKRNGSVGGVGVHKSSPLAKDGDDKKPLEGEDLEDQVVYEHDLFVEKRLYNEGADGEMVLIKHIMPIDGIREFLVPLAQLQSRDKSRAILSRYGVAKHGVKMDKILAYISYSVHKLQETTRAEVCRSQFGWHDNDSKFLIGTRMITQEGVEFSPTSSPTAPTAPNYGQAGHLSVWKEIANLYGRPGNEARAFGLGVGFGAPFVKFSGIDGFILHLTNERSGVGKTSIQFMANSIWGHPKTAMLNFADTNLARFQQIGVLQNIVGCIDEVTDLPPDVVGSIAFMITQGRGRHRMESQSNSVRENHTTWSLPVITSGNNSLHDILFSRKALPEGELMRILEVYVPRDDSMTKEESDLMFNDRLFANYGWAGEVMMTHVVNNLQECVNIFREIRTEIDKAAGFTAKERFYSAAIACAITGLRVAGRCGLHDIDVSAVQRWAVATFSKAIAGIQAERADCMDTLGQFINGHMNNLLVVSDGGKMGENRAMPVHLPKGDLVMRYEAHEEKLYISVATLREWCTNKQVAFSDLCVRLAGAKVLIGKGTKRLSAGMPVTAPGVHALCFSIRHDADFFKDFEVR